MEDFSWTLEPDEFLEYLCDNGKWTSSSIIQRMSGYIHMNKINSEETIKFIDGRKIKISMDGNDRKIDTMKNYRTVLQALYWMRLCQ